MSKYFPSTIRRRPGRKVIGLNVSFKLPGELCGAVDNAAMAGKVTKGEWLREAVRQRLERDGHLP